ncbi:hypothetical protein CK203_048509 [Vitis vinifera]|uniref:Disease resistance protein n=1 Tax=Vitis vinifera TaxID=29760 RepID=A0A438FX84_VITVI|nr:hypothetical protein CK203_048509 [Vitis vinifera]
MPSSLGLSQLQIRDRRNFKSLELQSCSSLAISTIQSYDKLKSLEMPSSLGLSRLEISDRRNLKSLELQSFSSLSILTILSCDELTSLELPSSPHLSRLQISFCCNLKSLELPSSPGLSQLEIEYCDNFTSLELQSAPRLSQVQIRHCQNLTFLKEVSLPSLEKLSLSTVRRVVLIMFVSASSSLESLFINNIDDMAASPHFLNQRSVIARLDMLRTAVISFKDWKCPKFASFEVASLPCLEELSLGGVGAKLLSKLISLRELGVHECCQLTSLPEEMHSLRNLQELYLCDSLILQIRCSVTTGGNWSRIAHIPHIHFFDDKGIKFKMLKICIEVLMRAEVLCQSMFLSTSHFFIEISICWILRCYDVSQGSPGLGSFTSLMDLHICDCAELTSRSEEMHSLKSLPTLKKLSLLEPT